MPPPQSPPEEPRLDGAGPPAHPARGSAVLRVCSVFEPAVDRVTARDVPFDPVGGMQTHTAALTRQLDARGVRQVVVTSRLAGPTGTSRLGAAVTVVRGGVRTRRLRQAWAAAALRPGLAARGRYDVVHAHQGEDLAVLPLGAALARWHGCPLVVTLHCSLAHTYAPAGWRGHVLRALGMPVERRVTRVADAVITLTAATAARLREDGLDPRRIFVIPSGVHVDAYRGAGLLDPFPQVPRPRVLYVGRLAPQKSVETLVEAAGRLRTPASVLVVGDGPERGRLQRLTTRLGLAGRVVFTGFVDRRTVPAVLRHADVLVLPSRSEELGSVLLEGLAAGVPIVASTVGGIPTVVQDGRTGLLVPPADPDGLAARLDELLTSPALASRLAEGARRAADRYSWDRLAEEVLEVYRAVATRRQVAG